jgi:MFS family permease
MKNEKANLSEKPAYKDANLRIVFGVTLMAVMGVASITPAFPKITESLGISIKQIGLLITVFTFPGIILTPVLGVLADRYGRKRILVPALLLFGVAGTACAFAGNFQTLLVFRFFQGIGGASLGSLNTTIIGDLYSNRGQKHKLSEAMGYNGGVLNIGTASYPAIGGFLAVFGWHYPFLLPALAIPVGFLVLVYLKNPEPETRQNLKEYLANTWKSFQNKEVAGLFIASLVTFIILYGSLLTYFPFFMKRTFGSSVVVIGLYLSLMSVASGITSSQLGKLSKRYSKKHLMITAFILYVLSLFMIPFVPNTLVLVIPTIIHGVANGLNIPSIQSLLAILAPLEYRAAFMSANGMVLRMGQTLGPIIMGSIFVIWGIAGTFFAGAIFALFMLVLIKLMIKE